jgi:hypothetical protein
VCSGSVLRCFADRFLYRLVNPCPGPIIINCAPDCAPDPPCLSWLGASSSARPEAEATQGSAVILRGDDVLLPATANVLYSPPTPPVTCPARDATDVAQGSAVIPQGDDVRLPATANVLYARLPNPSTPSVTYPARDASVAAQVVAVRMPQRDPQLGVAPTGPNVMHTDANAVMDGTGCGHMNLMSRWMSVRLALMRRGVATGDISPAKRASAVMVSDMLTKPLTGSEFAAARARTMGAPA